MPSVWLSVTMLLDAVRSFKYILPLLWFRRALSIGGIDDEEEEGMTDTEGK